MAGSDPLKTSVTAFRLGITKLIVPFVFVFSPSLLISVKGFTWHDFGVTLVGCMIGLVLLSAAFSRYFLVPMKSWERWLFTIGALLTIVPGALSGIIGLVLCVPAFLSQWRGWNHQRSAAAPA
ncbi:putative membrane protein [Bordetella holmesii ATCC 51541]|nr:putative membrane protein [Bordetella holmesii ATCC 51541]